jgi:hypothetical protein
VTVAASPGLLTLTSTFALLGVVCADWAEDVALGSLLPAPVTGGEASGVPLPVAAAVALFWFVCAIGPMLPGLSTRTTMFVLLGVDCVESAAAFDPEPFPGCGSPPPALLDADAEAWLSWLTGPLPPPFPTLTDALSFVGPCCVVEALLDALWPVVSGGPGSTVGEGSGGVDVVGSVAAPLPLPPALPLSPAFPFPLLLPFAFPFPGGCAVAGSATVVWPAPTPFDGVPANAGGVAMKKVMPAASVAVRQPPKRRTRRNTGLRHRVRFLAGGVRSSRLGALDHDSVAVRVSRMSTIARRVRSSRRGALDHDSAIREGLTST